MTTGVLQMRWKSSERDLYADAPRKGDAGMALHRLMSEPRSTRYKGLGRGLVIITEPSFLHELEMRGYDLSTFRLSVRRFEHLWIEPGAHLWHRKTGEEKRVHHVRWERGVASVLLVDPGDAAEDRVQRQIDADPRGFLRAAEYLPLEVVEREWKARPGEHPRSWFPEKRRRALRTYCFMCGTRLVGKDAGGFGGSCPKCVAEAREPNALVEALLG